MKRIFPISLILILCLIASACSYSVNFVVVNRTESPLDLEYKISTGFEVLTDDHAPMELDLQTWDGKFDDTAWRTIAQNEYQYTPQTKTVKFKLKPKQAVRILRTNDGVFFEDNYKRFEITGLALNGASGKMEFSGARLFRQFTEKNYSNRFIEYK